MTAIELQMLRSGLLDDIQKITDADMLKSIQKYVSKLTVRFFILYDT